MKTVCTVLGLARSNVNVLKRRPATWRDGRTQRTPAGDAELLAVIQQKIPLAVRETVAVLY